MSKPQCRVASPYKTANVFGDWYINLVLSPGVREHKCLPFSGHMNNLGHNSCGVLFGFIILAPSTVPDIQGY